MRRFFLCLLLLAGLFQAIAAQAQPVLTIFFTANTYGTVRPCPS
nr:hypothetical protein [Pseudodesulfovibrio alkaliphilus]